MKDPLSFEYLSYHLIRALRGCSISRVIWKYPGDWRVSVTSRSGTHYSLRVTQFDALKAHAVLDSDSFIVIKAPPRDLLDHTQSMLDGCLGGTMKEHSNVLEENTYLLRFGNVSYYSEADWESLFGDKNKILYTNYGYERGYEIPVFFHDLLLYSDYVGDLVHQSNVRVFERRFKKYKGTLWKSVTGYYGAGGIGVRLDKKIPEEIREAFHELEENFVLDEDDLAELEQETLERCWKDYGVDDFTRSIEAIFDDEVTEFIPDDPDELWKAFCDASLKKREFGEPYIFENQSVYFYCDPEDLDKEVLQKYLDKWRAKTGID